MTSRSDDSLLSSWVDLLPQDAPFDGEQRAWLNGFLAGLLGIPPGADPAKGVPRAEGVSRRELAQAEAAGPCDLSLRVVSLRQISVAGDGVDWRELTLDASDAGASFRPGDRLRILPQNPPDEVRRVLRAVGARGLEVIATPRGPREAWRCLLEEVCLSETSAATVELLCQAATHPAQRKKLAEWASKPRPWPPLLRFLDDYPSARPALVDLLSSLSPLRPREYFLASTQQQEALRILVRPHVGRFGASERRGIASQYLCETVGVGDTLVAQRIDAEESSWLDLEDPLTVVAQGTGIAWARGFVEQLAQRQAQADVWLILLSTSPGEDQIYDDEFQRWHTAGIISQLDRVGGGRKRVASLRELLRRQGRRLSARLEASGLVRLCGESGQWVEDFFELLTAAFQRYGSSGPSALERLEALRDEGRIRSDVY